MAGPGHDEHPGRPPGHSPLTEDELGTLRARATQLADKPRYLADVIQFRLQHDYPAVIARADQARDRIINRPDPNPQHTEFGTIMVID